MAESPVTQMASAAHATPCRLHRMAKSACNCTPNVGMGDGRQAGNPWLQEFPDPITRVSWDNYLTVSKADAAKWGLENENVANGGLNGSYVNITCRRRYH